MDNKKFKQISYSQSGEDLILNFIFSSLHIENPSYIDIGAHHPFWLSNTYLFYKKGSRGINIEPNPQLITKFYKHRKEDINLNIGISGNYGEIDFYVMSAPTMSTFSSIEAKRLEKENSFKIVSKSKVKVQHVQTVLDTYNHGVFPDFLSLDVEGLEDEILRSINFENNFPKVICLETLSYSENKDEKKETSLIDFLVNKGYFVYGDTYINTIFVKESTWKNR
ncbi:MAG: FkbM family methyltransferase [Bacteroidetes bacterium]|nr:FkbM family methyltransferase [Bacteroidota bacterium]